MAKAIPTFFLLCSTSLLNKDPGNIERTNQVTTGEQESAIDETSNSVTQNSSERSSQTSKKTKNNEVVDTHKSLENNERTIERTAREQQKNLTIIKNINQGTTREQSYSHNDEHLPITREQQGNNKETTRKQTGEHLENM